MGHSVRRDIFDRKDQDSEEYRVSTQDHLDRAVSTQGHLDRAEKHEVDDDEQGKVFWRSRP